MVSGRRVGWPGRHRADGVVVDTRRLSGGAFG